MGSEVELLYIKSVLFEFDDSSFVVVHIAVVGGREYRYHHWELLCSIPLVHLISIELRLMCPQDRQQLVLMQELVDGLLAKEV